MEIEELEKMENTLKSVSTGRMCHLCVMVEMLGYDFDKAYKLVMSKSMEELDKYTKINSILESIVKQVPLHLFKKDVTVTDFEDVILSKIDIKEEGNDDVIMRFFSAVGDALKKILKSEYYDSDEMVERIRNTIFAVHDYNVKNSAQYFSKLSGREKMQMLPIELIGLKNIEKELLCLGVTLYWFKIMSISYMCGRNLRIDDGIVNPVNKMTTEYFKNHNLYSFDALNAYLDNIDGSFNALSGEYSQDAKDRLKWMKSEKGKSNLLMEWLFPNLQYFSGEDEYDFKENAKGEVEYFARKSFFVYDEKSGIIFKLDRNGGWFKIATDSRLSVDYFAKDKKALSKEEFLNELNQSNDEFEKQFTLNATMPALQVVDKYNEEQYIGISIDFRK